MKEFIKLRNQDLTKAIHAIVRRLGKQNEGKVSRRDVVESLLKEPAPYFYLTFDYAYRILRRARRDSSTLVGKSLRATQLRELVEKVDKVKQRNRHLNDSEALSRVLQSPASGFFLSRAYAEKLVGRFLYAPCR